MTQLKTPSASVAVLAVSAQSSSRSTVIPPPTDPLCDDSVPAPSTSVAAWLSLQSALHRHPAQPSSLHRPIPPPYRAIQDTLPDPIPTAQSGILFPTPSLDPWIEWIERIDITQAPLHLGACQDPSERTCPVHFQREHVQCIFRERKSKIKKIRVHYQSSRPIKGLCLVVECLGILITYLGYNINHHDQ